MFLNPVGIQKRTITAVLGTALLVLAGFCAGLMTFRQEGIPSRVQTCLQPYAEMIRAAGEAGNKDRALQQILNSLKSNPQILRADLIGADGVTLAAYPPGVAPLARTGWNRPDGIYLEAGAAELAQSLPLDGRPGHLVMRMSLAAMQQRDRQVMGEIILAVVLALASFALVLYVLLRRWVLAPLSQLAAVAESVVKDGDYRRRMPAHGRDEFGQLGQRFNALLAGVEQRENELRQLANFQRAILTDAAYAIISTDQSGYITSLNPAAEHLFGFHSADLVGKATLAVFHLPEELAARAQVLTAKLEAPVAAGFEALVIEARRGWHSEAEWTFVRKDGHEFPGLLSVSALLDEQGEIFGFLGMASDITERKRTEAKLQEREAQYRLLFENMVTGFALHEIICDEQGHPVDYRYLEVNPAFERITGLASADLVGRTCREALPAVEQYWIQTFGQVALTGKPQAYENYFADLEKYYDTWVFSPRPGQFAVIFTDVTARRKAEESLNESRRLYEDLVASLPMGVYRVSAHADKDVLEYVSDRFCEIMGLARDVVLADESRVQAIIHPEDRPSFEAANLEAFQRQSQFMWEGRATVRGQLRWLHIESQPAQRPGRPPFWTGVVFDVTDRRDVEEALHQQHSLLEGALQATADGILAVSRDGKITSYNRQFLELWRVPREILDANDIAGLAEYILTQLSNPAAMQTRIRSFNDTTKADTFDTLEFSDGRVYERFSRPQLVAGRVVGRVWSFRDVTARHWAVAALRESEHKFKNLFETANDAILIMNGQVFVDCNQVTEVTFGCPRNQIIGQSLERFLPERQPDGRLSLEKAVEKIAAALGGVPQSFEWILARAEGTPFNVEVSLNRLALRGQTLVQAIVRDITARKQAEAAQRDAEQLYRTLVNTSPDAIIVLDMTGRVVYSSPRAIELFYGSPTFEPPSELIALDFVAPQDLARAEGVLKQALAGEFSPNQRLVMRRKDGREFVAELNGTLLRDGSGQPWGILVIMRDITERQRQEDELKSKNAELERFTYTVSHDLRSPLITIKGFAGALLADVAAGRTDRMNEDLQRIIAATGKMSELLNGLLALSRVGRMVNTPAQVSMADLVTDVLSLLAGSIAQRHAQVTVQPGLPPAHGDVQRLQEVWQNLVENALKFSAPGQTPEIEIGFKPVGDQTAYFVRDQGRGIESRFHDSIFGLFNKLDSRSEGTGIGLALVRRIVEYHGGTIWVESAGLGQGATFYFTLPARKALSSAPV
jgi:PAS domain S-box-containing protein